MNRDEHVEDDDHEALLDTGFHRMTYSQLWNTCENGFSKSGTRAKIMRELAAILRALNSAGARGDLWIGGSFLTRKTDPLEVDVILMAEPGPREELTWKCFTRACIASNSCQGDIVDDHYSVQYPKDDSRYPDSLWEYAYWIRQFGFDRLEQKKGIAVLTLPVEDVPAWEDELAAQVEAAFADHIAA